MTPKYKESSRLKNPRYLALLNGEFITTISWEEIESVHRNIDTMQKKNKEESKALVTLLYLTGARPAEILNLKAKDIKSVGNDLYIHLQTLKHGKPRTLALPKHRLMVKQVWDYGKQVFPEWWLFPHYRCKYVRKVHVKERIHPQTMNIIPAKTLEYMEVSAKLRYHFKKWFAGIDVPPYFLRHNRFSIMAEKGASEEDIKQAKGARSVASVDPYMHLSAKRAKKFSRFL